MGDSISLECGACKSTYPPGKLLPYLFIGRGIEVETIGLPSYCMECKKYMVVTAENNNCKKCNSKTQLLGDFTIQKQRRFNQKGTVDEYWCDWKVLSNESLGLTILQLKAKSKLSILDRLLINTNSNWKEKFCLVFKIGFNKFYHCPSCSSYAVKLYPAFVSWD